MAYWIGHRNLNITIEINAFYFSKLSISNGKPCLNVIIFTPVLRITLYFILFYSLIE